MSMRKRLADTGAISVCLLGMLCNTGPSALAKQLSCTEVNGDGLTSSKPAVAAGVQGGFAALNLFIRGLDNGIYENRWFHPDGFTTWDEVAPVGGGWRTISEPAAVVFNNQTWVFMRGTNNLIYYNIDGKGWIDVPGNWQTLSGPTAVTDGNSGIYLFVRGTDNRIYMKVYNGNWSNWFDVALLGKVPAVPAISEPAAVLYKNGVWLFIRGTDNRIYLNKLDGTPWTEVPGGGLTVGGPSALVDGPPNNRVLKLFVTGTGEGVWENDFTGNWSGWAPITDAPLTASGPAAAETFEDLPNNITGFPAVYLRIENEKIVECY